MTIGNDDDIWAKTKREGLVGDDNNEEKETKCGAEETLSFAYPISQTRINTNIHPTSSPLSEKEKKRSTNTRPRYDSYDVTEEGTNEEALTGTQILTLI